MGMWLRNGPSNCRIIGDGHPNDVCRFWDPSREHGAIGDCGINHGYWFSFLIAFLMALLGFLLSFKLKRRAQVK